MFVFYRSVNGVNEHQVDFGELDWIVLDLDKQFVRIRTKRPQEKEKTHPVP
jgi:hypothetical protein